MQVAPETEYHFVLIPPNGQRQEIGTIKTPAAITAERFDFPTRRPSDGVITISWRELPEAATLTLFRANMYLEGNTQVLEAGSATDPTALRRTIGPGFLRGRSGQWRVPAEFLATEDGHELRSLGAEILVSHAGKVAKTFAKESFLSAESRLILHMECAVE